MPIFAQIVSVLVQLYAGNLLFKTHLQLFSNGNLHQRARPIPKERIRGDFLGEKKVQVFLRTSLRVKIHAQCFARTKREREFAHRLSVMELVTLRGNSFKAEQKHPAKSSKHKHAATDCTNLLCVQSLLGRNLLATRFLHTHFILFQDTEKTNSRKCREVWF